MNNPSLLPIPDGLVVLTFDDGNMSDIACVAPLLRRYGFGATFYVTEGLRADAGCRLTWQEIRQLHEDGFEIGNHTGSHPNIIPLEKGQIRAQVEHIERRCREHGIPSPRTFAYPGGHHDRKSVEVLAERGYLFARRGVDPEYPLIVEGGRGPVYVPGEEHPLLVPSTTMSGPNLGFEDLVWAVEQARDGRITVLTFHGVPDVYPYCSTEPAAFERYMKYLHDQGCTVIAMRDLAQYVDPAERPKDPYDAIRRRMGITPAELRCEYLVDPLGIDSARPRFSWVLHSYRRGQMQSAYQILVASTEENLKRNMGDLWDSGKVASDRSVNIPYEGRVLVSGQRCWWKVRCWNATSDNGLDALRPFHDPGILEELRVERPSAYSRPATFEMGLLNPKDWQGRWIGADKAISSPLLRAAFALEKEVKRASVYVSGLGYYELYVNGGKIGTHVLDPGTTYYNNDQPIDLCSRVLYVTYDVTDRLRTGSNAIGVMLGHGWYSAEGDIPPSPTHREPYGDRPRLILQMEIEFADGGRMRLVTDDTWRTSAGPIVYNDYNNGEVYDARLEKPGWDTPGYDDSDWARALPVEAPSGVLRAQTMPAIQVVNTRKPVRTLNPSEGVYVFDFGQNFCGWSRIRVCGPKGTEVRLRHAAEVYDDGTLDARSNSHPSHIARQTDRYILRGEGTEVWEPRFTLHGFRYVEVTGFPGTPTLEALEGRVVRSAVERIGRFDCSDSLVNRIHHNVCWTFESCLQSVPQDAADRSERVPWLGDPGFIAEDIIYNYDTAGFWTKWMNDIRDSQTPDGDVPVVSPIHWRGTHSAYAFMPAWKSTYPLFVWYVYWYYEDERIMEEHYDGIRRLVDLLGAQAQGYILSGGLGDHMEPQADGSSSFAPRHTPAALTSTAYYYYDTVILVKAAEILGRAEDAERYSDLAERIKEAFNREFLNPDTNRYATGSQTSNALPLYLGMVPGKRAEAVLKNLVDDILIAHKGHLSTGIIGTNAMEQALPEYGAADVMYGIVTQTTFPSWGYQIARGATTLWETWDGTPEEQLSLNMKMFGSTEKFFYKDLAGIGFAHPGYRRIIIRPQIVGDLTYARASVKSVRGMVAVDWRRGERSLAIKVTVPANTTGEISMPKMEEEEILVTESGQSLWEAGRFINGVPGIVDGRDDGDRVVFKIGSGSYAFQLTGQ